MPLCPALLLLGLTITLAAAPALGAPQNGAEEFEVEYGVTPPDMVQLSPEEAAAERCERLGPFTVREVRLVPGQRTGAQYELLLGRAKLQLLREWADALSLYGKDIANQVLPNAVLLEHYPSAGAFQEDGRWYARGYLLLCASSGSADEEDPTAEAVGGPTRFPPGLEMEADMFATIDRISFMSQFDAPQREVGEGLRSLVLSMDQFFADEQVDYKTTGSFIKVTGDTVFREGGKKGFIGDVRVRIGLPRTQEKLKLILESDPDQPVEGPDRPLETTPGQAVRERAYFAGLQATFGKPDAWRFRPSVGVKVRNPPDLFTRFQFSRAFPLGGWIMRLNQTFYWFDSIGVGEVSNVEFDHLVLDDLLFRSNTYADWQDRHDYFDLTQIFALIQKLGVRRALAYEVSAFGVSEPSVYVTDYLLAVRYRQNIHSDYLFAELIPQVRFRKDADFEDEHSLILRLELLFRG